MRRTNLSRDRLLLLAALLAGTALRLFRLGSESLWYDEAVSVFLARQSPLDLIARTAGDIHPPGYYLLLHLWGRLAQPELGHGLEFVYAWVSAACGLLILALLYPVGKHLVGRDAALIGVWLAAVNPFHLWYSQEVRMYTLGGALALLCLYATLRWAAEGRARWLIVYGVTAAAGLYVYYYFAFVLVGIGLALLVLRPGARRLVSWLLAHAGVLLLYAPWIGIFWRQATDPPVPPWRQSWASAGEVGRAASEALAAYVMGQTPVGPLWLWALVAVALAVAAVALARPRRPVVALLVFALAPLALLFGLTLAVTPLYHVRYLFPFAGSFALITGAVVAGAGERVRGAGALILAALVLASALGLRAFWQDPRYRADDHRAAVAALASQWRPGDVILANAGWIYPLLEVYWPTEAEAGLAAPPPLGAPARLLDVARGATSEERNTVPVVRTGSVGGAPTLGWGNPASDFFAISAAETEQGLDALAAAYDRIWHYRLYDTVSDPQGVIRAWLDDRTRLLRDDAIPGRDFGRLELRDLGRPGAADPGFAPAEFGGALRLVGAEAPSAAAAGETIYVTLVWEPLPGLAALPAALSSSLRLYGADGTLAAQSDAAPALATTQWEAGELVRDTLAVRVPADAAPGAYSLELVVYRQDTAAPLVLEDARAVDGQRLRLGSVEVSAGKQPR